jgi:oligosaccharide repeat unit polymerase
MTIGLLVAIATVWGTTHSQTTMLVLAFLVVPIPIIVRVAQGRWDPFEPIQTLCIAFFILFPARAAAELAYGIVSFDYPQGGGYARDGFAGALAIAVVGALAVWSGYFLPTGRNVAARLKPLPTDWDTDRALRFVLGTLVVCAMGTALFALSLGGPGALIRFFSGRSNTDFQATIVTSAYVYLSPQLTLPSSLILLLIFRRRPTLGIGLLTAAVLLAATFVTVPRGDRTYVIAFAMPLLSAYYLSRNRRPSMIAMGLGLLATIFMLNVLLQTRRVETRAEKGGIVENTYEAIVHPDRELENFLSGVDLSEFTVLEVEYSEVKSGDLPFHPGATLASTLAGPLPRKIVGDKPKSGLEYVTNHIFPVNDRKASFGPSFLGDLYADWGWGTVVLYCLLIGVAARVLWEYFLRFPMNSGVQMLLASALPLGVILARNSLPDVIARSVFLTGPVIGCMIYSSRSRKDRFGVVLNRRRAPAPAPMPGAPATVVQQVRRDVVG